MPGPPANPTSSGNKVVYDASGNVLYDANNEYWYDGEGRICASQQAGGGSAYQYVYDPEGARIEIGSLSATPATVSPTASSPAVSPTCSLPSGSSFTLQSQFLVDMGGSQVTELNTAALNKGSNGLGWVHSNVWVGGQLGSTYDQYGLHFDLKDPLGSKRVQADNTGAWEEMCTSLAFGNDLNNPSQVNCSQKIASDFDATEHHFTGKERDAESGNDYFPARYYSSSMGRWLSPDWSAKAEPVPYAKLDNPQSLNLYAYVLNNPLKGIDPDGHACIFGHGSTCSYKTQDEAAKAALQKINKTSIKKNREFGGEIYKNAKGKYQFTKAVMGGDQGVNPHDSKSPEGSEVVGDYHTHGDYSTAGPNGEAIRTNDPAKDEFNSDHFSGEHNGNGNGDKQGIEHDAAGKPEYRGYLGTPSGKFLVYNPNTGVESELK